MADEQTISIPVAYNTGSRPGGVNFDDEPVGFNGFFSPYMKNMVVESTRVRKRQGYSSFGTGARAGIGMALINYTDAEGGIHLLLITTTKKYKYNASTGVWDDITGTALTGDADDRISATIATDTTAFLNNSGSALVISNGVDDIQEYEGQAADTFAVLAHTFPSFGDCNVIVEFWNHFFILNYTDSSKRVRSLGWAGLADIDDWTSATSAVTTLTDSVGDIINARKLSHDLVIYSDRSISLCRYVGGVSTFVIPTVIYETGLLAFDGLCSLVKSHYFLGTNQQIYVLQNGSALRKIGQRVEEQLFAEFDMSAKARAVTGYSIDKRKVLFFIPQAGSDYAKNAYVVNTELPGQPWEYYQFAHGVRSIATLRRVSAGAYCDDAEWSVRYCDEVTSYCDDTYGQADADMTCFLSDDGTVYKLDEASGYDDSSDINAEYHTEDFVVGDEEPFGRFTWFSFTAYSQFASVSCNVYYSTDDGSNWTELADSAVTLQQAWTTHRLPLDVVSRRIRFKLVQNGYGDLQLRSFFRVRVVPQPERD